MLSKAGKKNTKRIKQGPKMLNFGAAKPGVREARAPRPPGSAPVISSQVYPEW